ncbi:MAG: tetratricopeptide repeat protein [Thermomicrobiales bacterium]
MCAVMAREIGDQELLSESLNILGYVARGRRDLATAASLFQELLDLARTAGEPFWEAASLINLGNVAFDRGDYAAAERFYAESLKSVGVRGDRQNTALALANLGVARLLQGKFDAAREPVLESATICHDVGDSRVMALSLAILGLLAVGERQFRRTAQLFGAAEIVRERAGLPLPPAEVEHHERAIAAARRALGEEDFASAWAVGRALVEDEILDLALERAGSGGGCPGCACRIVPGEGDGRAHPSRARDPAPPRERADEPRHRRAAQRQRAHGGYACCESADQAGIGEPGADRDVGRRAWRGARGREK